MATLTLKKDEPEKMDEPELVTLVLELAPASGGAIVHAGVMYVARVPYKVTPEVARDLTEIANRGWSHESSLRQSENTRRKTSRAFV